MSIKNFKFVSPGVFINEIDQTSVTESPVTIGPVVIGRAQKGLAMQPVVVNDYEEFVQQFGETVPGKGGGDVYRDGNNQSPMYGTYAAKAFLRSNVAPLTYVRLLVSNPLKPLVMVNVVGKPTEIPPMLQPAAAVVHMGFLLHTRLVSQEQRMGPTLTPQPAHST